MIGKFIQKLHCFLIDLLELEVIYIDYIRDVFCIYSVFSNKLKKLQEIYSVLCFFEEETSTFRKYSLIDFFYSHFQDSIGDVVTFIIMFLHKVMNLRI